MYIDNLYIVMTRKTKGKLVNFRVRDDLKREFEIVADLRGTTLSGLIHQLMVKAVREEKERDPAAFIPSAKSNIQEMENDFVFSSLDAEDKEEGNGEIKKKAS